MFRVHLFFYPLDWTLFRPEAMLNTDTWYLQ